MAHALLARTARRGVHNITCGVYDQHSKRQNVWYLQPPEKLVINFNFYNKRSVPFIKGKFDSFTAVLISTFTLTNRTQHRGAKPLRR